MTARQRRLLRLVQLRERQHDLAALALRASRAQLAAAQAASRELEARVRGAQLLRVAASIDGGCEDRLLACAEAEAAALSAANSRKLVASASSAIKTAQESEQRARRERKQMEATLEGVQREGVAQDARAEQLRLDEIAHTQRQGLTAFPSWRRTV